MPKKRPETFDDLDSYERDPVTLALINLADVPAGVLSAADSLVTAYRSNFGDLAAVSIESGTITVTRPKTEAELTRVLERDQKIWDRDNEERVEAEKRSHLKVGDELKLKRPGNCEDYQVPQRPCSLPFGHGGKHIKVVDGHVAEITER